MGREIESMVMRSRRVICFVLGVWLGAGLLMDWQAAFSFRQVDRLLTHPGPVAEQQIRALGFMRSRDLLRHAVAEQNRVYFQTWEIAQLALGGLFFLYLLFGTSIRKSGLAIVLGMLLIVAAQRLILTPRIAGMERRFELLPPEGRGTPGDIFRLMHSTYSGLEVLKLGLALGLAARMAAARRGSKSGDARDEFDLIDKPNYGHVDG